MTRFKANQAGRIAIRVFLVLLAFALLAFAGVSAWFYLAARSALPQLDGSVQVSGLKGSVTVIRDSHGVPHIRAAHLDDLFMVQGYVTAQDRLWQMDMLRRYAAGELSEVAGAGAVNHDRTQRILGIRQAAEHAFAALQTPERRILESYARGVNAVIEAQGKHLPMEFRVMGYKPRPWRPEQALLISAFMCQLLNHYTFDFEIAREKALKRLGPELTSELYVDATPASPRPGSNNWVVSGVHTRSGKPLLSNDMHLPHQMPNLWYEAHLQAGDFDVGGVTLPGAPFVIVGHNRRIAWGFTNLGPDVEDIYIEEFNEKGEYRTPAGWVSPRRRHEVIHVKNEQDIELDVLETRHGPVVTELVPDETRKLSLRWTLYDPAALGIPFFDVDSARNWDEFRAAFSKFGAPAQNVVYADVDGHIGYQATGFIPIRKSGTGVVPVPGSDDSHEWTGYVPFEKLPSVFDPTSGILATANARITPDNYPYLLGKQWDAPYRTERIFSILDSRTKLGLDDMLRLQTDVFSDFDRRFAQRFAEAVQSAPHPTGQLREAARILKGWDGMMTRDAAAPTIETAAREQLARLLLEPKLGKDYRYHWFAAPVWLESAVTTRSPRWLPAEFSDYNAALVSALEKALGEPRVPTDISSWRWGAYSPVLIEHPVFRNIPLLGRWTAPGLNEQSGGSYTVKQVGINFGPSERLTVDFADFDKSVLNTVTGQAGNILSPYYMDQWSAWYLDFTFTFPFSAKAVEREQAHHLVLQP